MKSDRPSPLPSSAPFARPGVSLRSLPFNLHARSLVLLSTVISPSRRNRAREAGLAASGSALHCRVTVSRGSKRPRWRGGTRPAQPEGLKVHSLTHRVGCPRAPCARHARGVRAESLGGGAHRGLPREDREWTRSGRPAPRPPPPAAPAVARGRGVPGRGPGGPAARSCARGRDRRVARAREEGGPAAPARSRRPTSPA